MISNIPEALNQAGDFNLEPFGTILQPIIEETLSEYKKDKYRKGTILTPFVLVWLVLTLPLRRDLSYPKAINWLISGLRWLKSVLPAKNKIITDGAISHARVKLGIGVFKDIFKKFGDLLRKPIEADFHGWITVMFDGTTMTMPDTDSNTKEFGKPKSKRGSGAFPQVRVMALLMLSMRAVYKIAFAPYSGKKTGERTLMFEILKGIKEKNFLFLFDAGFYSFLLVWYMKEHGHNFIMKISKSIKLAAIPNSTMPDGSYLAVIKGKIEDPSGSVSGRKKWKKVEIIVRVIVFQIPGFQPVRLITSILDPDITAKEIIRQYHKRWDIEISYDEIKTHQCATLRGQMPTVLRSKRADLVKQELYAILITYNLVRCLIYKAALKHSKDPLDISFLDTLHHIIEAAPYISVALLAKKKNLFDYLLDVIADSLIDRPRRPRVNPRVIKIKMSKFKRKRKKDKSEFRNFEQEIKIITEEAA